MRYMDMDLWHRNHTINRSHVTKKSFDPVSGGHSLLHYLIDEFRFFFIQLGDDFIR